MDTIEINVAIYTDEKEDEEFYGPYGRTRYFMWALSDYSWQVGDKIYQFKPTLLSTQDILNGHLTIDQFDVLLYPPSTADENLFITGFSRLPNNKHRVEHIVSFIESGGGYFGTCAGSAIAGTLQNKPLTFFETMWKKSALGISVTQCNINMAVPILSQWIGRDLERISIGGYIQYSGWNQSNYSINYHSGACLDIPLNKDNPLFDDCIEKTRKIRWVSGAALIPPEDSDREVLVLAQFPQEEISDNLSTRIHHWRYNGGLRGLLKAMILGSGGIHYWEHLGIFMRAFVFAEDWDQDIILETDLADKPFMTTEIYPNQNQAHIVLCSGHPEYNVWWGGHIEEVEDNNHNNIYDGFHHWKDVIPEEETIPDEFSYNYWIVRRSVAWAAKIPDNDLPPIYGPSQICDVYPHEQQPDFTLTGNAEISDGIASLDLYYRYSKDNRTWDKWTLYETDTSDRDGWSWTFSMPKGAGYYQFYSLKRIRYEYGWYNETPPPGPDAYVYVEGWQQINEDGFGTMFNRGIRGMEVFDDCLIIGTANYNNFSGLVFNRSYTPLSLLYELVLNGSRPADNFRGDGCEIWCYNGTHMTQLIGGNPEASMNSGFDNPYNLEVGVLINYKNYLYAGLRNQKEGCQIWRTQDLINWVNVVDGGFGNIHNVGAWSAVIFNDSLYIGTMNFNDGCELFKTRDGVNWYEVVGGNSATKSGFGTKQNFYAWSMCEYHSELYVGTDNLNGGGELWKTNDGASWKPVLASPTWIQAKLQGAEYPRGFSRGLINYRGGIRTMAVYHDELYVGLAAEDASVRISLPHMGAIGLIYQQFPFLIHPLKRLCTMGCEIWKFNNETNKWTRVVGGLLGGNTSGGFGDWKNEYPWSMISFDDNLYVGTLHPDPLDINIDRNRLIRSSITMVTPSGKGEIWRYDGTQWEKINNDGFGDAYNIGIRNIKDYKGALIAGTMNLATGCELWRYN